MSNSGFSHRWKRFDTDLRRKLPVFPISIAETSLRYPDLEKIQKRATEIGIPSTYPNERFVWVMKVLNNLEKWAAHIIPVNDAESVKDTIAYLKAAEQQFGLSFMRTVPLYKTIKTSNRKFFRILEDYEDRKDDEWIPKSVSTLEIHYLEKIVTPYDLKKIVQFNLACHELVEGGYFTSDGVITATHLLGSLHNEDLRSNPLYPLLASFNIGIPPSEPCFVRVDSRLVAQLVIVILLMKKDLFITRKAFQLIRKSIQDKITDANFRKSAEPFISHLAIKVFPDSVTQLVQLICNKYGHPAPKRKQDHEPYRPFTASGMTTRHRQRLREQSKKTRLFISPSRKIAKLISEGSRLLKSDSSGTIQVAIEDLKSLQNKLREEETSMSILLSRTDVKTWELGKLIQWKNDSDNKLCPHLFRLRASLENALQQLVEKITLFRFNRNIIFFRKFIHIANDQIGLIRGLADLVQWSLDSAPVPLADVETVLARFHSPPPLSLGIVRLAHDSLGGIRENLKKLDKPEKVSVVREIVESIQSGSLITNLPFSVNIANSPQISTAITFLDKFDSIKSSLDPSTSFSHYDSLNHSHLSLIWRELRDLLATHKFILDDDDEWWKICFISDWFVRAKSMLNSNSVSDLIALHQELVGLDFVAQIDSPLFIQVLAAVDSRIEQIQSVIDRLDTGNDIEICLNAVCNVSFSVIDQYRMLWEDYRSCLQRLDLILEVVDSRETQVIEVDDSPPVYRYSVSSIRSTLNQITLFEYQFPKNKIENPKFDRAKTIVHQVERVGSITDRAELEAIIRKYGRRLVSPELEKLGELIAQVQELEIEISEACKKDIALKPSETPTQSFSRIFESLLLKYDLMKRANRSQISLVESVQVRLSFSTLICLSTLLRLWTSNKRDLDLSAPPRWTILFIARSVAGFLGTHFKTFAPKFFAPQIEWLSKQLNASNEILKEAKKSLADFAKTRFMIPMFHFALYEPMEKIRKNFEAKLGIEVRFCYRDNSRQLDYICTVNGGKVVDRFFPSKLSGMGAMLSEPINAEETSILFEQRSSPQNFAELLIQLSAVVRAFREDVKESKTTIQTLTESKSTGGTNEKSKGPLSFTKFLSLNFANIDLETSDEKTAGASSSQTTLNDYWINNVDQIVGTGESSFFEKYIDLIEESKRARKDADIKSVPSPIVTKPTSVPSFTPPPTFAPPPCSNPNSDFLLVDKLVTWSGKIEGGSKQPNLNFDVSLVPVFRPLPPTDLLVLQRTLAQHPIWTLEGSMGIGKFCDYYQKLTSAANRRRREPYTFLLGRKDNRFDQTFFDSIPLNSASAFAVVIQSQKIKLWVLSVDGSVDYKPLPVLPGVVFGMLEMPPAIFSPSAGFVDNIYHPLEMNHLINQLNSELMKTGNFQSVYVSLTAASIDHTPPSQKEDQWLGLPTGPVALAVPKPAADMNKTTPLPVSATNESLARVFEMIGQEKEQQQQPVYNPYIPARQPATATTISTSGSAWSRPNIVIGAPSTGPSVNDLPNPRKGSCRFYNTAQGCQQGQGCKFLHMCSVCGDESHNAIEHYSRLHQ